MTSIKTSNNNIHMNSDIEKSLPNLVKEIIFFYVKYYYDKKIKELNVTKLTEDQINLFVEEHYTNKEKELRDYVRKSLKKNQGSNYNTLATENILLEIFSDETMAKERIKLEIQDYQINHI
jgi:hypothetical protein